MTDILVVDDEPDIRGVIGDILEDEGHGVRLAWDSDTALGEIEKAAPDLVIRGVAFVRGFQNLDRRPWLSVAQPGIGHHHVDDGRPWLGA